MFSSDESIVSDLSIADDNICIVRSFSSVSNVSILCNSKKNVNIINYLNNK